MIVLKRSFINKLDSIWKNAKPYFIFPAALSLLAYIHELIDFSEKFVNLFLQWNEWTRAIWRVLLNFVPYIELNFPDLVLDFFTFVVFTIISTLRVVNDYYSQNRLLRWAGVFAGFLITYILSRGLFFVSKNEFPQFYQELVTFWWDHPIYLWNNLWQYPAETLKSALRSYWSLLVVFIYLFFIHLTNKKNIVSIKEDEDRLIVDSSDKFSDGLLESLFFRVGFFYSYFLLLPIFPTGVTGEEWYYWITNIFLLILIIAGLRHMGYVLSIYWLKCYVYNIRLVGLVLSVVFLDQFVKHLRSSLELVSTHL